MTWSIVDYQKNLSTVVLGDEAFEKAPEGVTVEDLSERVCEICVLKLDGGEQMRRFPLAIRVYAWLLSNRGPGLV